MNFAVARCSLFYRICITTPNGFRSEQIFYHPTYDLIENFINWHYFNTNFSVQRIRRGCYRIMNVIKCTFDNNARLKIMFNQHVVNFPRNSTAIFIINMKRLNIEPRSFLADVIKIYFDHNGCQLNEANLAKIMNTLRQSKQNWLHLLHLILQFRENNEQL